MPEINANVTEEYVEAVKAIVKEYTFSCSAQAIYWDRDHYNACHPPHPSEGVPFQHDYPNPPKMPPTAQAPADNSVAAYAPSEAQQIASNNQAIPPERLMPWFHAHIDPEVNRSGVVARTFQKPSRGRLIPTNPGSLLNRNPMNDIPANLNAVFPLPEPSLTRYQPFSLALPNFRGGNASHQRADNQETATFPRVDNMLRQINTYKNFGYSWEEIAKNLIDVGGADDVTAESVRLQWEKMQGDTDYHWTGPVVKKNDAVEPGEFAESPIEAVMKGRFYYPKK
ncbi:MAG: hypothetical protein Q9207_005632 [Kuettlingeria erythrocarpa]